MSGMNIASAMAHSSGRRQTRHGLFVPVHFDELLARLANLLAVLWVVQVAVRLERLTKLVELELLDRPPKLLPVLGTICQPREVPQVVKPLAHSTGFAYGVQATDVEVELEKHLGRWQRIGRNLPRADQELGLVGAARDGCRRFGTPVGVGFQPLRQDSGNVPLFVAPVLSNVADL